MAKTKKKLSKAEAFCLESQYGKKDAADMAKFLDAPIVLVQTYLDGLAEAGFKAAEPEQERSNIEKAGFGVHDPVNDEGEKSSSISVVMTKAASEMADQLNKSTGRNEKFFDSRVHKGIHVIDPKRPVR